MLSRLLLSVLVVVALAFGMSLIASPSDVDCGPVEGTLLASGTTADATPVPASTARVAALIAFPGAAITEVDLDEEDGFLVYEVGLTHDRDEFDVVVDAGTGEVLCTERD